MHANLRHRWKAPTALVACELFTRSGGRVHCSHVVPQAGRMRKFLLALLASVQPVLAVCPLVRLQVVDMRKALAARITHQWLLVAMNCQMFV